MGCNSAVTFPSRRPLLAGSERSICAPGLDRLLTRYRGLRALCGAAGLCRPATFGLACGAGEVGGDDVGGVPVEGDAGSVVRMVVRGSACDAASWASRNGTPASRAAVMKAWRRVCGPIGSSTPARRATRRTIRLAQWWSIRCPSVRRKIGPLNRSPMARSIARAVRGASGIVTILPPLRSTVRVRCRARGRVRRMFAPRASEMRSPLIASSEIRACSLGAPRPAVTSSDPTSFRSKPMACDS
jgi:hypothetical protein